MESGLMKGSDSEIDGVAIKERMASDKKKIISIAMAIKNGDSRMLGSFIQDNARQPCHGE
jgi:hypothetical protein